ncbi:hypothetical protein BDZ97DRAFT_1764584 [Flammula alnicola]|nr:hypothetical protein BDZ97DRAFT_1764584 [Flammula alnicola]
MGKEWAVAVCVVLTLQLQDSSTRCTFNPRRHYNQLKLPAKDEKLKASRRILCPSRYAVIFAEPLNPHFYFDLGKLHATILTVGVIDHRLYLWKILIPTKWAPEFRSLNICAKSQTNDGVKTRFTKVEFRSPTVALDIQSGESSQSFAIETFAAVGAVPEIEKRIAQLSNGQEESEHESKDAENKAKTQKEFFEELILGRAKHDTPCIIDMKTATEEEKTKERRRRLDARTTSHRFVFQTWPRDPHGKGITPENSHRGKEAPNGLQLWGATLSDFYIVYRWPDMHDLLTTSSGSKLAAWMKANGESYAQDCIEGAEEEEEPREIHPCDIGERIEDAERLIFNKSWILQGEGSKGKGKEREEWELPHPVEQRYPSFLAIWPPKSPFDPSAYPAPWPREPFTSEPLNVIPTLQSYLPSFRLPAKLIVHDPWNLLSVEDNSYHEDEKVKPWSQKPDITHVYKLRMSEQNPNHRVESLKSLLSEDARAKRVREMFLQNPHSDNALPTGYFIGHEEALPGSCKPPIYVVLPEQAVRLPPPEAHLYLSPAGALGTGNHSFVYKAELELARALLVRQEICHQCMLEDMAKIIEEEDGKNGERRDPKWDQPSGRHMVVTRRKTPAVGTMQNEEGVEETYLIKPGEGTMTLEYQGPFRVVESRVQYQDLAVGPYCEHIRKQKRTIHPLTSKVYVAAKLSIEGDEHLQKEAENYMTFPRHFFEHWSGYNIINPLKEPVPVGPLVPQFYGYYVVDEEIKNTVGAAGNGATMNRRPQYLSPILLLEDCGEQIDPGELSVDDQTECASLVYRLHEAGWIHGSVARRNIVRQPGPLSAWPLDRIRNRYARSGLGKDWSYRLIDFGRSFSIEGMEQQYRGEILSEESGVTNWVWGMQDLR